MPSLDRLAIDQISLCVIHSCDRPRFTSVRLIPRVEVPGVVSEIANPDALLLAPPNKKPDYEQAGADQDVDAQFRDQVF